MVLVHRYWHTGRLVLAGTGTLGWDTSNGTGTQVLAHWPTRTGGYWYTGLGHQQWYWYTGIGTLADSYWRVLVHWAGTPAMVLVHRYWHTGRLVLAGTGTMVLVQRYWHTGCLVHGFWRILVHWYTGNGTPAMVQWYWHTGTLCVPVYVSVSASVYLSACRPVSVCLLCCVFG